MENTQAEHELYAFTAAPSPAKNIQTAHFNLEQAIWVNLELINAAGQTIRTLLKENLSTGKHQYQFDVSDLDSGVFFYKISSEAGIAVMKSLKL